MPGDGPTLPDMLATVPHLLRRCAPAWDFGSIQALRLVSRELSVTSMREVRICSVQLGEGACPTPRQVAHFMKPSQPRLLTVTVITTSGRPSPTLAQQLATCTSQTAEFVQSMSPAIQSVVFLTIAFQHRQIKSTRRPTMAVATTAGTSGKSQGSPPPTSCPASFAVVTRAVCAMLAAALPCLSNLTLRGCCRDPAFSAFGASCPHLIGLQVEALSLPIRALKGITTHLPQLTGFVLASPTLCPDSPCLAVAVQLMEYLEASLLALQPSTLLNAVRLGFDKRVILECKPGDWLHIPPNLHEFDCGCILRGIHNVPGLLSLLRTLSLNEIPRFEKVIQILSLAPHLQELDTTTNPACVVWCEREDTFSGIALLRERLLTGLHIYLPSVHLVGSNAQIAAVMAALPASPFWTRSCVLQFVGDPQPNCLSDVARVFTRLNELTLLTDAPLLDMPVVGTELLEALAACTSLTTLWIRVQMSHTTSNLLRLCLAMPALITLRLVTGAGVSLSELTSALAVHERVLDVQEIFL